MDYYQRANDILRNCTHSDQLQGEVTTEDGILHVCCDCWNQHVHARRAARKAELAAHNATLPTCDRCGRHPVRWIYGPFQLCGRCKNATEAEHWRNANATGQPILANLAGGILVNTTAWALPAHT
jgi:hypothetical protein